MGSRNPTESAAESRVNFVPLGEPTRTYMVAPRRDPALRMMGVQPLSAAALNGLLATLDLNVIRRVTRTGATLQTLGAGTGEATDILVARIEPARAELLSRSVPPSLVIAEDKELGYQGPADPDRVMPLTTAISPTATIVRRTIRIRVLGLENRPLPRVTVGLAGDGFPSQGLTDERGEVDLDLITLGERMPRLLTATPSDTYWDLHLSNPQINPAVTNVIRLQAISETIPGFPQQATGWGRQVMGLQQLPREVTGAGVKIAIIDSGCDNSHPLLRHITLGADFTGDPNPAAWNQDLIGHGTHCAGVIAARSEEGAGLRGFAPEAEIHILRVFPGGQYSNLIEALDYCIEQKIDLVNMSLGGDAEINPVVEETLQAATLNGIACVVAAGNSGDAVRYPARSPQVLAVSAVGRVDQLPPHTWARTTVKEGQVAADGTFTPTFTCRGPEVGVCAPGVGIISTAPGGAFKVDSGTSMAAPHITGMAALLLAHHPVLQSQFRARSPQRVAALFQLIRSLATPYPFDRAFTGAGLPNLGPAVEVLRNQVRPAAAATGYVRVATVQPGVTPMMVPLGFHVTPPVYTVRYSNL